MHNTAWNKLYLIPWFVVNAVDRFGGENFDQSVSDLFWSRRCLAVFSEISDFLEQWFHLKKYQVLRSQLSSLNKIDIFPLHQSRVIVLKSYSILFCMGMFREHYFLFTSQIFSIYSRYETFLHYCMDIFCYQNFFLRVRFVKDSVISFHSLTFLLKFCNPNSFKSSLLLKSVIPCCDFLFRHGSFMDIWLPKLPKHKILMTQSYLHRAGRWSKLTFFVCCVFLWL